jgi:hypothetical protein
LDRQDRIPAPRSGNGHDDPGASTQLDDRGDFNSRITDNILRVCVNYKFDPNEIWGSN